ncbi:MAG: BamA/TamA family outer membrane protein [Rhodobacteraceae bacterium]|nr:BamA/TamA family outer membrane protein [Paracoccaceae bacterium]
MRRIGAALALVSVMWAPAADAFDLRFAIQTDKESVREAVEAASLLGTLPQDPAPSGQEILAAAQADYGRLISALYDAGYFGPEVSIRLDGREVAAIPAIRAPASVANVVVKVTPGRSFTFGRASVGPLSPQTEVPAGFAKGAVADLSAVRAAAQAAREGWRNLGHAKAEVSDQSITARHNAAELDVTLSIAPGPKLTFGPLRLSGESAVRPERIRAIAGLPTGEVFSPSELDRARNRLQRTGTFQAAALFEAEFPEGTALPIDGQITDRLPRTFGFGAEVSSEDGLTLSGYWQHRNLFGGAERLRFDAEIGGIGGSATGVDFAFELRFDKPAIRGPDVDGYAFARADKLDERHYSADRLAVEVGLINRKPRAYTYSYGIGSVYAEAEDAFGARDYWLLTLPATATYDTRDNPLNARSGLFGQLSLTPFAALQGADHGLRTTLDLRSYRRLGDKVTLAFRGQVGSLAGPSLSRVPVDFAFYAGGGGSIRGFAYQSIGVDVAGGDVAGGRSFATVSGEVRVQTGDKLSVVGFVDSGFVQADVLPDITSGDWNTGVGLGVRYDTGLGPIRLDVATPVGGPADEGGFEIYIGIGQAF